MPEIRLDGEKLLKHIEGIEYLLNVIRRMAAMEADYTPRVQGVDLTQIEWRTRDNQAASLGDKWSWAFGYDQNGDHKPESRELVQRIEQYGRVEMDGFEMTLSGRDKRLLNRKKLP